MKPSQKENVTESLSQKPQEGENTVDTHDSGLQNSDLAVNRSEFLRTAGSCALVIAMGLPIAGCSVTDSEGEEVPDDTPATGDNGITVEGNTITIDLTKEGGQPLASSGGWLVSSAAGIIALNIDGTLIRAFTNSCPHQGVKNQWNYSNGTLVCNAHGSAFDNNGSVVNGPAESDLTEYSVSRDGNIVTITK
jgi:Rieske Fe-S protein